MHVVQLSKGTRHFHLPEKIHTHPKEEISAIQRGRKEKFVSDNI
jgi:hypothetical protein